MRGFHFQLLGSVGGARAGSRGSDELADAVVVVSGSTSCQGSLPTALACCTAPALALALALALPTLARRLAAGVLGAKAAALQGVAVWPSSAKARLAFLSRSLTPMIGRWPRAGR